MTTKLPENVTSGEIARLFPVIAETRKEQKATSILLSLMSAVRPLSESILGQLGQKVGKRSVVEAYTEVVFSTSDGSKSSDRPDGLIYLTSGKNTWACLVEAKIGKSELDVDQVERYVRLARDNGIDAVLTISNQFASLPSHHPLAGQIKGSKKVELFHLSWRAILTDAIHLQDADTVVGDEQAFMIQEFVRFFSHPSAGVAGFTTMPSEWSSVIEKLQAGGRILKSEAAEIVGAWHQELRDLTLQMSQLVGRRVETRLSRKHAGDAKTRVAQDVDALCSKSALKAEIVVPDAAAAIDVTADLTTRSLRIGMTINAPRDKARSSSRANWLIRQLKSIDRNDIVVGIVWASRSANHVMPLSDFRANPKSIDALNPNAEIRAFDVTLVSSNGRRFSGVRTFIEELETLTPAFYEFVGQHLTAWQPSAPKPRHSVVKEPTSDFGVVVDEEASDVPDGSNSSREAGSDLVGNG